MSDHDDRVRALDAAELSSSRTRRPDWLEDWLKRLDSLEQMTLNESGSRVVGAYIRSLEEAQATHLRDAISVIKKAEETRGHNFIEDFMRIQQERDSIRKERDELLAALKLMVPRVRHLLCRDWDMERAEAAIAKVEGAATPGPHKTDTTGV